MTYKLTQIIVVLSFILSACSPGTSTTPDNNEPTLPDSGIPISDVDSTAAAYPYLNSLRQLAGLNTLSIDSSLANSAYNHAEYLITNEVFGHDEDESKTGFTGVDAGERAVVTGYFSRNVGEGLSTGKDALDSIDNLMSAIYHRFTLFSLDKDEIGMTYLTNANTGNGLLVHNIGNSNLNMLCQGTSFTGAGTVYYNVCEDINLKILTSTFNNANDTIQQQNPEFVVWPAKDATDIPPAFFEETPDPLPDQSVSGYPVSVQFNPAHTQTISNVSMSLFNVTQQIEVTNVLWMQQGDGSDPATSFTSLEFALFPLQRLDWNSVYEVNMTYTLNGVSNNTQWQFTTRALPSAPLVISDSSKTIPIKNNQTNFLYFVPAHGNDLITQFSMSFPSNVKIVSDYVDSNTLQLHISGNTGDQLTLTANGTNYILKITS